VVVADGGGLKPGMFVDVRVESSDEHDLYARAIEAAAAVPA